MRPSKQWRSLADITQNAAIRASDYEFRVSVLYEVVHTAHGSSRYIKACEIMQATNHYSTLSSLSVRELRRIIERRKYDDGTNMPWYTAIHKSTDTMIHYIMTIEHPTVDRHLYTDPKMGCILNSLFYVIKVELGNTDDTMKFELPRLLD